MTPLAQDHPPPFLLKRARRNRQSPAMRTLSQENTLSASDLVAPCFVKEGLREKEPIAHLPGVCRFPPEALLREAERLHKKNIPALALFPSIPRHLKDPQGSEAYNPNGIIPRTIARLKQELPSLALIADVALDPYTSHGHDGIATTTDTIDNDQTLEALARQAVVCARAGADILAPSATMDGRVRTLRLALDANGLTHAAILSYTAKYASAFYTPFRTAIETTLQFGDKASYQLNPFNRREALREARLDEDEGADMLLVKPALPYLDVLTMIRAQTTLPIGAYQVSGEYAMVMAAAAQGYLDPQATLYEMLAGIKRAGADFIVTYAAPTLVDVLNSANLSS